MTPAKLSEAALDSGLTARAQRPKLGTDLEKADNEDRRQSMER